MLSCSLEKSTDSNIPETKYLKKNTVKTIITRPFNYNRRTNIDSNFALSIKGFN